MAPLTRARILEAALALVDKEGCEALTMRRLGAELGVAAMSLYNHVANREDLLDGLSETLVGGIGVGGAPPEPRARLRRFMAGIREVAHAHPDAFRLVGMRPLHTERAIAPVEAALAALGELGLGDADAVRAYRAMTAYARGFALAEITGFTLEETPGAPDAIRARELDPGELPNVVRLHEELERPDRDATFEFGAEAILDGIEQAAKGRPDASSGR